jgi:hypothetical protein
MVSCIESCSNVHNQIIVPHALRASVINAIHSGIGVSHLGRTRTEQAIKQRAYWAGWNGDVRRVLAKCKACVCYKRRDVIRRTPIKRNVCGAAWDVVCIDSIKEAPPDDGPPQFDSLQTETQSINYVGQPSMEQTVMPFNHVQQPSVQLIASLPSVPINYGEFNQYSSQQTPTILPPFDSGPPPPSFNNGPLPPSFCNIQPPSGSGTYNAGPLSSFNAGQQLSGTYSTGPQPSVNYVEVPRSFNTSQHTSVIDVEALPSFNAGQQLSGTYNAGPPPSFYRGCLPLPSDAHAGTHSQLARPIRGRYFI